MRSLHDGSYGMFEAGGDQEIAIDRHRRALCSRPIIGVAAEAGCVFGDQRRGTLVGRHITLRDVALERRCEPVGDDYLLVAADDRE